MVARHIGHCIKRSSSCLRRGRHCKLGPRHDTVFVVNLLYFLLRGNSMIVSSFYLRPEDSKRTETTLKYDVCLF